MRILSKFNMAASEQVIQKNTGRAFVVKKGQILRVIGEATADFVVFNLRNVKDTYQGTHDMEKGMCSTSFYKKWGGKIFKIYGGTWKKLGRKKGAAPKHG